MDDDWLRADAVAPGKSSAGDLKDRICWWCDGPISLKDDFQPLISWKGGLKFWHYNCIQVAMKPRLCL